MTMRPNRFCDKFCFAFNQITVYCGFSLLLVELCLSQSVGFASFCSPIFSTRRRTVARFEKQLLCRVSAINFRILIEFVSEWKNEKYLKRNLVKTEQKLHPETILGSVPLNGRLAISGHNLKCYLIIIEVVGSFLFSGTLLPSVVDVSG